MNFLRGTLQRNDNIVKERLSIKLSSSVIRHEDDLVSSLVEQQKEIFEKYKNYKSEIDGINELKAFIGGFKLTTKIMMEVVQSDE